MDFIKRHYEKLLLLFMLVLFIGIMFYVVSVADQARSIKDSDLTFRETDLKRNKVEVKSPASAEFNTNLIIEGGKSNWQASTQRRIFDPKQVAIEGTYSDLVAAMSIASCPHCKNLIPRFYFRNNVKCPACAVMLADVPPRPKGRQFSISENDLDGDGMPNSYETSKGFNPNNPDDQLADADGDGFSNFFEYENNTDPKDPRSRMPLWYRLRYISMESVVLPIRFRAISTQNSKDKSKWLIQIRSSVLNKRGRVIREEELDYNIGGELKVEDKLYKIVDATYDRQGSKDRVIDNSTVTLQQVLNKDAKTKPDVLVLRAEQDVRSNDKRLVVEDVGKPLTDVSGKSGSNGRDRYIIKLGSVLRIGKKSVGYERYRLASVDERAKTASFVRANETEGDPSKDINGKKILVTRDSEIPDDVQVTKSSTKDTDASRQGK